VFNRVKSIPDTLSLLTQDPWYREYSQMAQENYRKPYPRPFPCGSVLLGFDRRNAEMIGHRLDISNGLCEVFLKTKDKKDIRLQIFTNMEKDQVWMRLVDQKDNLCENIFDRIRVLIDPSTPAEFPKAKSEEDLSVGVLAFRQVLPYEEPDKYDTEKGHPKDKAFRLAAKVNGPLEKTTRINWDGNSVGMSSLEAGLTRKDQFISSITLHEGLNKDLSSEAPVTATLRSDDMTASFERNENQWREYWNKSGVKLSDQFLEMIWYHNLYFLNCATKEGVTTPDYLPTGAIII